MPFYEYQCDNCGHSLEAMQKVSDAPLKKCPHCGKAQLKKLMSAPVFRLKGAGWYETDFKSDQDNKRNLADRPDDAPKDEKKEKPEAGSKDAAADATKSADKPTEKAAVAEPAKKPADSGNSGKSAASEVNKSNPRKAAKRPARKPAKRAAAKPARRR